jgi:hypothetical protein
MIKTGRRLLRIEIGFICRRNKYISFPLRLIDDVESIVVIIIIGTILQRGGVFQMYSIGLEESKYDMYIDMM